MLRVRNFLFKKYYPCSVAGESFDNEDGTSRQEILAKTRKREKVYFLIDKGNKFDTKAIAVFTKRGQIGYLQRDANIREMVRKYLYNNIDFKVSILSVRKSNKYYGAVLKIQNV